MRLPSSRAALLVLLAAGAVPPAIAQSPLPVAVPAPATAPMTPPVVSSGRAVTLGLVRSAHVAPRRVDVWLPAGYDAPGAPRYGVLYMHDGQNLFDPALAFGGAEWRVDEVLGSLLAERAVRPTIVVGVWNTPARFAEYMPEAAVTTDTIDTGVGGLRVARRDVRSDAYLRFLVDELKPMIDRQFRTDPGREATTIMGSSMGGLISAYAIARYPAVFGGAGCISTHWPAGGGAVVDWLGAHLPPAATHRLWFDHGTATLDSLYAPYQSRMDTRLRRAGYVEGRQFTSRVYPGAEHSERSWAARLRDPLQFLLHP
jgi:predicted alpha/beta superfamily hydrolase